MVKTEQKTEIFKLNTAFLREILDSAPGLKKQVTTLFNNDRSVTYKILEGKRNVTLAEGLAIAEILISAGQIKSPFDLVEKDLSLM